MILKKLSDIVYLLQDLDGNNVDMILRIDDDVFVKVNDSEQYSFTQMEEKIGNKITYEKIETNLEYVYHIEGYPINRVRKDSLVLLGENLYKKNEKSDVIYCAGYYGIKFDDIYSLQTSPKQSTLLSNEWIGAYKDKKIALFEISAKNSVL